jgi:hypothetical protein
MTSSGTRRAMDSPPPQPQDLPLDLGAGSDAVEADVAAIRALRAARPRRTNIGGRRTDVIDIDSGLRWNLALRRDLDTIIDMRRRWRSI